MKREFEFDFSALTIQNKKAPADRREFLFNFTKGNFYRQIFNL